MPPKLFQFEQELPGTYTDWVARLNYKNEDGQAVRFRLSTDHHLGEWTITVEQEEDGIYGEWEIVTEKCLAPEEGAAFLALDDYKEWTPAPRPVTVGPYWVVVCRLLGQQEEDYLHVVRAPTQDAAVAAAEDALRTVSEQPREADTDPDTFQLTYVLRCASEPVLTLHNAI